MITADDLRAEIENLKQQRQQAADVYQQATGALLLAESMLARFDGNDMTVNQFAEMIGGNGATADITPLEKT